jgi:hypothetical protein
MKNIFKKDYFSFQIKDLNKTTVIFLQKQTLKKRNETIFAIKLLIF